MYFLIIFILKYFVLSELISITYASCPSDCTGETGVICVQNQYKQTRTFESDCHFKRYQCVTKSIYIFEKIHDGLCCDEYCYDIYKPLCGENQAGQLKTFPNECEFDKYNCNNLDEYKKIYDGECECALCDPIEPYVSICGKNQNGLLRTFPHYCSFWHYNCNCKNGLIYEYEYEGNCKNEKCKKFCTLQYDPQCGKNCDGDYEEFENSCLMSVYNCEKSDDFIFVNKGNCCPKVCNSKVMPVCGLCKNKILRTFRNKCEYFKYNCEHPENKYEMVELQNCCPQGCTKEYAPVCAKNEQNDYMEFSNECLLKQYNCDNFETYAIINDGHCCPKTCKSKKKPVCATCKNYKMPKTFRNNCEYFKYNCKHPEDECKITEWVNCCPKACTEEYAPVCAKNEQNKYMEFSNECILKQYNCDYFETFVKINCGKCCPKSCPNSQKEIGKD